MMRRNRFAAIALVAVLIVSILAGCSTKKTESPPDSTQTEKPKAPVNLVISVSSDPEGLNPMLDPNDTSQTILNAIYDKLVYFNDKLEVVPGVAQRWDIEDGGKQYTFHLKEGIKFHDGKPLTSADVKFSLETAYKESAMKGNFSAIESVEAPDAKTVVVKLKQAYGPLLSYLAQGAAQIIPKHLFEGNLKDSPASQKPVGSGPYMFSEWSKGQNVTLVANKEYWRGAPNIDKVIFRIIPQAQSAMAAMQGGEVNVLSIGTTPSYRDLPILSKDPRFNVVTFTQETNWLMIFNTQEKPWSDVKVRQAVAHAIDKAKIVAGAYSGVPKPAANNSPLTANVAWAYNPSAPAYAYDTAKANTLLDEAGLKKDGSGVRLKTTLDYTELYPGDKDMWMMVRDMLGQVGIVVELNQLETGAWLQTVVVDKKHQLAFMGGGVGPDPDAMRQWYHSGGITPSRYANPEVDKLLDQAASLSNQAERRTIYLKVQEIVATEVPSIPMFPLVVVDVWTKDFGGRDPIFIGWQDWSKIQYTGTK